MSFFMGRDPSNFPLTRSCFSMAVTVIQPMAEVLVRSDGNSGAGLKMSKTSPTLIAAAFSERKTAESSSGSPTLITTPKIAP